MGTSTQPRDFATCYRDRSRPNYPKQQDRIGRGQTSRQADKRSNGVFGVRIAANPQIEFTYMDRKRRIVAEKGARPMSLDKLSGRLTLVKVVNKNRAWFPGA
jgi:hypothetical protein